MPPCRHPHPAGSPAATCATASAALDPVARTARQLPRAPTFDGWTLRAMAQFCAEAPAAVSGCDTEDRPQAVTFEVEPITGRVRLSIRDAASASSPAGESPAR